MTCGLFARASYAQQTRPAKEFLIISIGSLDIERKRAYTDA
jgi:hypothetical protein